MGCGWFSKNTAGMENKRNSNIQQRDSRMITKNEHSAPPIPLQEISTSSDKATNKKNKAVKKDKSKKKHVKSKLKRKDKYK
jgi:hypothetical protein